MERRGTTDVWSRLAPWAGVAFAVLFVAAFVGSGTTPDYDDPEAWTEWLSDSGNRWQSIAGALVMIISTFGFLWFVRSLINDFVERAGRRGTLASIGEASATLFVAFAAVGVLAATTPAAAVEIGEMPVPQDADIPIIFEQFGFSLLLIGGGLSAAVAIACVATLARQDGRWPGWLVWIGYGAAFLLLFASVFFPFAALPLWALVTGIYLGVRRET